MSYLRTTPLKWLPSADEGVTVQSGGSPAWATGAYVELVASMAADSQLAALSIGTINVGAGYYNAAIDIAVGGAGVEVVIATKRVFGFGTGGTGDGNLPFAVPIDKIPAGSRVSARVRDSLTAGPNFPISIGYFEGLDSDHITTRVCFELPANGAGVSLTPNGTAWANSAWVELTSGIGTQIELALLNGWRSGTAGEEYEFDLGTGGAGSETVVTTLAGNTAHGAAPYVTSGPYLPRPYPIDANTRIAVRLRKAGTDTTAFQVSAEYYDDPLLDADTVPIVQTLPATAIRTTQAKLRGRINPAGVAFTGRFAWGTAPGSLINVTSSQVIGSGTAFVSYSAVITGLLQQTNYYFQAIGDDGGSPDLFGEILSFQTLGEQAFIDGDVSFPLTYLELTTRDEETRAYAEVDLNDPPDYHYGYKAPWVQRFLTIARGLSDRDGQIEHLSFGANYSDTHRYFRGLFDDPLNQYLTNRPLAEWFIDDEDRRVLGPPRLAAVGYVNDYSPKPNLQFELKGADWLKKKFSRKRKAQQSWQPLITVDDFPNCPEETLNTPAPIIYGALGLTGADPVENVQITENAQPAAAPASFALSLQAGGRLAGVRRYYKAAGIVAGQETVQTAVLTEVTTNTNKTIRATWTAVPGATAIYLYSSNSPDFSQFAVVVLAGGTTQYDDDTTPPNQDAKWLTGTDWELGLRLNVTYYVFAKLDGGLYSRPGIVKTEVMPNPVRGTVAIETIWDLQQRDFDLTWDAHPDEVDGYRIVRHRSYYSNWNPVFDRQMDVSSGTLTVNDDLITRTAVDVPADELISLAAAGQVEAISVGAMDFGDTPQLLNVLLIARHPCARVGNIYLPVTIQNVDGEDETTYDPVPESEFGTTWFAPDHAGWLYATKYVEINNRWYTLIATTLTPLPDKVLVDVDGVDEDGDGEGALIPKIVYQRLHFACNWIAPDFPWESGPYFTAADTTFPHIPDLPLVDEASHHNVNALLEERLTGGYEGGQIIGAGGEFVTATDALARFQVSGDFDQTFNRRGQDSISAEPIAAAEDPDEITDVISIRDGSFTITDQVQTAFFNILPHVHTRDYTGRSKTGWYGNDEVRSQTSIDNYDQERESPRFELHGCRANTAQGAATIADVMARKLARYQDPRRVGTLVMPFSGLNYEPGTTAAITHIEGVGAQGWIGREVRFTRHEVEPTEGLVRLDLYDLTAVFANQIAP